MFKSMKLSSLIPACGLLMCLHTLHAQEAQKQPDRAWVMSSAWRGYMGVAISLKGDRYQYWFYSDFQRPDEPTYPLTGTYKIEGNLLILQEPKGRLYADKWVFIQHEGMTCLSAERDIENYARALLPDTNFKADHPFRNQIHLHIKPNPKPLPVIPTAKKVLK
jgi:hypothetical protein